MFRLPGAPCVRRVHSSNKHCVAVYRPISTRFQHFFQNGLLFQKCYIVLIFVARWRHNFRKIAFDILQSVNNRTQSLREILRMVIIDMVINTLLGRLTLDPAGMHCPSWDDAFVSSLLLILIFLFNTDSPFIT